MKTLNSLTRLTVSILGLCPDWRSDDGWSLRTRQTAMQTARKNSWINRRDTGSG